MEPHTQQILYEIKRLNTAIQQIRNELNSYVKREAQIPPSTVMVTIPSVTQLGETGSYSTALEKLRPSREILDDLQLLNESFATTDEVRTLARYHVSFALITSEAQLSAIAYPEGVINANTQCVLPFFITDEYVVEASSRSVTMVINGNQWYDHFHVYYVTRDSVVQRVSIVTSVREQSRNFYHTQVVFEPLTMNVSEFLQNAQEKGVAVLGLNVDGAIMRHDVRRGVFDNLLMRSLLYLKARDYILDNQTFASEETSVHDVASDLARLHKSTISIVGVEVPKKMFTLNFEEVSLMVGDVGDESFGMMARALFDIGVSPYENGNRLFQGRVMDKLENFYQRGKVQIPVRVLTNGDIEEKSVDVFGAIINEFQASKGVNVFSILNAPVDVMDYSTLLTAQLTDIKYEHPKLMMEISDQRDGEPEMLYDTDFVHIVNKWAVRKRLKTTKLRELYISGGAYFFPAKSIIRFLDIFVVYPQMLPFGSPLKEEHKMILTEVRSELGSRISFVPYALAEGSIRNAEMEVVKLKLNQGLEVPVMRFRIPMPSNAEDVLAIRQHHYFNVEPKPLTVDSFSKDVDYYISQTTLEEYRWEFFKYNGTLWEREVKLRINVEPVTNTIIPILSLPTGFTSWTREYDVEYLESIDIISSLIYRSGKNQIEINRIKGVLSDVTTLVNHLVEAVNKMDKAFTDLTTQLQKGQEVPWWKKVLQGVVMVAGLVGTIVFPFSLPLAIGLIASSTLIQVGMMFAEGDYIAGGVQLAGMLIGLGTGYYASRRANTTSYPVTNLKEAGIMPGEANLPEAASDGLWIEVKPLKMLGSTMESIGEVLITKQKKLLRTLFKLENAPVHARVRSVSTREVDGVVTRTTIVSGVTDGMPYLSHINPRPGTFELRERYDTAQERYVDGWTRTNVPKGGGFDDLPKSVQGLLIEGVGTNAEFQSVRNSWALLDGEERAIALNDAQQHIRETQTEYSELPKSRVPISFDDTLVRNISDVFAKHTGIYELTGVTQPGGANNCQTYSKELRDFLAKGQLRKHKLANTSFLNDLMDAFDTSTQFTHVYKPALTKNARVDAGRIRELNE